MSAQKAGGLTEGGSPDLRPRPQRGDEQLEQRLLRVAAVLGLLPDALALAIQDLGRDLLAGMGGKVVHRERPGRRRVEQGVVEAIAVERGAAL